MPTITVTITSGRFEDFKTKFLKVHPNNETEDDTSQPQNPDGTYPQKPKYTDNKWLKEFFLRFVKHQYHRGEKLLYNESQSLTDIDNDII